MSRAALFAGTSMLALALAAPQIAHARSPVGASVSATTVASDMAAVAAQQAAAIARQSQASLTRATQAIQAMQAVQNAARQAAVAGTNSLGVGLPSVTNGLSAGGLIPDSGLAANGLSNPVATWVNANTPTQTTTGGQTTVTVQQTGNYALLNWQQFNIGKTTTLAFDQGGNSTWVALNQIAPSGVPSQVLGSIKADGAVYVINQNGVIFGGSSQINVNTLIASSLNISNMAGFLAGTGIVSSVSSPAASFNSVDSNKNAYSAGDVTVQAGAQISAPGGKVLLMGQNVRNDGAIDAPAGQVLLLGGSDVILNDGDSYTRGFVVTPNPAAPNPNVSTVANPKVTDAFLASSTPGSVINNGLISAPLGNITIVGGSVAQNGTLTSTTSTTANGSIMIQAQTGNLVLGGPADNPLYAAYGIAAQPSLLQILPDSTDQALVTDSQAIANSSIALTGVNVDIKGIVQLRGYDVTNVSDHPGGIAITATGGIDSGSGQPIFGRVFLEDGSLLDASGTTDATASASRNSVAAQLRSIELSDSPVIKAGPLYQQTIYVDASASGTNADGTNWYGTPLANVSAWIALIGRSLDERLMNGAPITIGGLALVGGASTDQLPAQLVQAPGSVINIAGGYMTYTAGLVQISRLVMANGRVVSASNALPDVEYLGVCCSFTVDHAHWGVTETYASALSPAANMQPGYIQGGAGGSLTLAVSSAVLGGSLYSSVVNGEKQLNSASATVGASLLVDSTNPPATGNFFYADYFNANQITVSDAAVATASQSAAGFNVATDLGAMLGSDSTSAGSVYLPLVWINSGLKTVTLGANDKVSLPAGNAIVLPTGAQFTAKADTVDVESSITAQGGSILLSGDYTQHSPQVDSLLPPTNVNGTISVTTSLLTIGAGVTLSTAGTWTDDAGVTVGTAAAINGGTITLASYGDIQIGQGSVLDVSGGGHRTAAGKITGGNGGALTITAGIAPILNSAAGYTGNRLYIVPTGHTEFVGGLVDGQLKGYGFAGSNIGNGGTLSLTSSDIVTIVSGGPLMSEVSSPSWAGTSTMPSSPTAYSPAVVDVSTDLFSSGGFAKVNLTAAGIKLPADVILKPVVSSLRISGQVNPSATSLAGMDNVVLLQQGLRQASSISLHATGDLWNTKTNVDPSDFSLDIDGTIQTDPAGSITLAGDQLAVVRGTVNAPGGTISLSGGTYVKPDISFTNTSPPLDGEGVWLTSGGQLLATGVQTAMPLQGSHGIIYEDVLPGGTVTVSGGDIILAPGSTIDVSGATGNATLAAAGSILSNSPGNQATPQVSSAGGEISVSAVLGALLEGTLAGHSGGGNAAGGTLSIYMQPHPNGGSWPAAGTTYIVLQPTLQPGDSNYVSASQLGRPGASSLALTNANNLYELLNARIPLSTAMIGDGGFSSLVLTAPTTGMVTFSSTADTVLRLPDQVVINAATIVVPYGRADTIQANYFNWNAQSDTSFGPGVAAPVATGVVADGSQSSLSIIATTVDLIGQLAVQGGRKTPTGNIVGLPDTSFTVAGDLRLNGLGTVTDLMYTGSLVSTGDLVFIAGQIYPSTNTSYTLASQTQVVFMANGPAPQAPLSAGGELDVYAPVIQQFGTLRAPTGSITLGSTTDVSSTADVPLPLDGLTIPKTATLTLGAGSLTSVSADGETTLYGHVINGDDWVYGLTTADTISGTGGFLVAPSITAPPAKHITLAGSGILVNSGSKLDGSGGGDLYAGEFVQGTGGSKNIFTEANVFAVIPGYTGITPYDREASTTGPSLGQQVYLSGIPGLPAGYYTLLPGSYAELPGAFLVKAQIAPGASTIGATRSPIAAVAEADGSYLASGYMVTPGTGTTDEHWSVFTVMSDTVARKYSEINDNYANAFFPAQAQAAGLAIPRLPQDGGQLTISAIASLNFLGTSNFTPAAGGLGGLADITANQILVVDTATRDNIVAGTDSAAAYIPGGFVGGVTDANTLDIWNPVVLSAADLGRLGVESLLLGGSRSFQSDGAHVSATATQVVIANDANEALTLPDIQFVARPEVTQATITGAGGTQILVDQTVTGTGQVIFAGNAVVRAIGFVAPGAATVYHFSERSTTLGDNPDSQAIMDYYAAVAANQVAYVRLSSGGLVTAKTGSTSFAGLQQFIDSSAAPLATNGSVVIGAGAQLIANNSLMLLSSGTSTIAPGVTLAAQSAQFQSSQINVGSIDSATRATLYASGSGLVLDQAALDDLAGIANLSLISSSTINLYGDFSLGQRGTDGQPLLKSLIVDAAGVVEAGATGSGTAVFIAEQVTLQNTLGGTFLPTGQVAGTALNIFASDVTGTDPSGTATGYNNAKIILGAGASTLAGFGDGVLLASSGQIVAVGGNIADPTQTNYTGSLTVASALTLDAPRITAGSVTLPTPLTTETTTFHAATYTINAEDNPAAPGNYYAVNLIDSTGAAPSLPSALLGSSLTINGGATAIYTTIALPGGAFNVTVGGAGNGITVGAQTHANGTTSYGIVDVSGQALQFVDVLASIGGGNINLTSESGAIAIQSGANLNVGDLVDVGALNQTTAGTLLLSAKDGGVSIAAGTLHGEAQSADSSGSFVLDTLALDGRSGLSSYDDIAAILVAGGLQKSWDIRARAGDVTMAGLSVARSVTVSTDTGDIRVSGIVNASGATGGQINLWAGNNLILNASADLNAHGATADANGKGGQVLLAADAAGNGAGLLTLNVGATIDVTADTANGIDSGPVLGGQVTFSASRTATNDGVLLAVNGGSFASFLNGVRGESAWDGIVVVGNKVYSYSDTSLILTPTTTVALSGGTETVAFTTYLNEAATFMGNEAAIWGTLQAATAGKAAGTVMTSTANAMLSSGLGSGYTNQVLVNIRPGIVIKNSGDITILGDATNPKGIDLSGSAYAGSVLNKGDTQTLNGHFGQYDEPVVLALRAAGNLNFGTYTAPTITGVTVATLSSYLTLGTLSDGFSQYTDGLSSYVNPFGVAKPGDVSLGAGASAWAAAFDPAAAGAYNNLSGGLGASSASYFLTAGADLQAADPLKTNPNATRGTLTVAGVSDDPVMINGTPTFVTPTIAGQNYLFPVTTDPLFLYNYGFSGGNFIKTGTATPAAGYLTLDWIALTTNTRSTFFADYASLVRTGTGNIAIGTSKDLVLQSPLSLIYTAGTGYNVNGTSQQPLAGFTQYAGMRVLASAQTAGSKLAFNYLVPSTFPTHGGDVTLDIGGNILADMNTTTILFRSTGLPALSFRTEDLPYDMTALGSQLKLENWITQDPSSYPSYLIGSFNALYATGNWLNSLPATSDSFYTLPGFSGVNVALPIATAVKDTAGNFQLAWFTQFPYLENTIGSFGGGNITAKVGGSISNVQFVAPTNARDAGPSLVASQYAYDPTVVQNAANVALANAGLPLTDVNDPFGNSAVPIVGGYTGLFTQGGGNISVTAGGNISNVYTYAQNGTTTLQAGGSVTQVSLATASGNVSVQALGTIAISDKNLGLNLNGNGDTMLSGIALIQNASILGNLAPVTNGFGTVYYGGVYNILQTVLTGILTSPPTGSVTLNAVGSVTLDVSNNLVDRWNVNQGILPAQVNLISLGGDVVNNGSFTTYPDPAGTVNLLARGSVELNAGFNLSDADPAILPTLTNVVSVLAPFQTLVTAANAATATLTPAYDRLYVAAQTTYVGGANYLAGQDTGSTTTLNPFTSAIIPVIHTTVLQGDAPIQLLTSVDLEADFADILPNPVQEAGRHAGLHKGADPARIIALAGDVAQGTPAGFEQITPVSYTTSDPVPALIQNLTDPYVTVTKPIEVYAGRDVRYLALIGQNNNATDVTSIIAGRDVIYPALTSTTFTQVVGIAVGGPGDLVVQSGRNVDLGSSTGIQSFGNFLNKTLPTEGAGITIEVGLGSPLGLPNYANFITQFVDPATAAANPFAEPLQLFDADGKPIGSGNDAYAYLQTLSGPAQQILLNRVFFGLVRDSGREHTGAAAGGNYETGTIAIDTAGVLNAAYASYQRAFAVSGTFFGGSSGTGSFLGGLSTVRTRGGGDITVLAPHGEIQVGLTSPPAGFSYALPTYPLWALNFGIVTEKGGNISLYADRDVTVNQSRVFTLEGGDLTVVSLHGNIDAGKGAKTVQAIQPPSVVYDVYGNATIEPYAASTGSGLASLRSMPDVPLGNADLIAMNGFVNAGDAGIRVSGNLNIAALAVLNAANIQVGGKVTGVPTVEAPNIGSLTTANNVAGAGAKVDTPADSAKANDRPSIIIVEVLGYGGGDGAAPGEKDDKRLRGNGADRSDNSVSDPGPRYDLGSAVQILGAGQLANQEKRYLTAEEQRALTGR